MSAFTKYTEADLARGRKIARSQNWAGKHGSLREDIAKAIAEERADIRIEMLGKIARSETEIERFLETIKRIWSVK